MRLRLFRAAFVSVLALSGFLLLTGCRHHGDSFRSATLQSNWKTTKESARKELTAVPPPSKNLYFGIHEASNWQNPFLSIGLRDIQLRVYLADENTSPVDRGGLTRMRAARRQELTIRLAELPRALTSLPDDAWPYGRVVGIDKGYETKEQSAQIQHNLELTIATLNDLGVAVNEME